MHESVQVLLGTHDFSGFRAADCQAMHPVRKITKAEPGGVSVRLSLVIEGTAFLKHMVRNIVGSVAEVGRGKQPPSYIADILRHGERTRAARRRPLGADARGGVLRRGPQRGRR
jgi:tRNA pseudouridine38-40 synthase